MLMKVKNPYIVNYYGIHNYNNEDYLVTEYLSDGSVTNYLQKHGKSVSLLQILSMAKDACNGMLYLQRRKIGLNLYLTTNSNF